MYLKNVIEIWKNSLKFKVLKKNVKNLSTSRKAGDLKNIPEFEKFTKEKNSI